MTHEHEERRKRTLSDEDIIAIKESFCAGMPVSEHAKHHELFSQWLEREAKKREARDKIMAQVTGWGLIAALGSIGTFAFHLVEKYIQEVASRGGH